MIDWETRAAHYADGLADSGAIPDAGWWAAFAETPRHVFVPRYWALNEYNAPDHLVNGADAEHRDEWLDAVYSDRFLATQWTDDGDRKIITSSASLPSLVATMLHLTDIHDGHRVLEIGTGSGYNTALLCHRVGDGNVVTIDIDPDLTAEATARLGEIGYRPLVVAGDGAAGAKDGAPYDRILSTCASPGVPAAWIDQLAVGGTIVAPFTFGGALAVVHKVNPTTVEGHFDAERAWFMPLRPAGQPMPDGHLVDLPDDTDATHHGVTYVELAALDDPGFVLWLCLQVPDARTIPVFGDDGVRTGVIVHTATARATMCQPRDDRPARVTQDARRLWDHVEIAWRAWLAAGRPSRRRIGLTATTHGTARAWLDTPDSEHSWPLPV
jgi:protein-L-isoaspartate(D-aspartate) O-methyltransferase